MNKSWVGKAVAAFCAAAAAARHHFREVWIVDCLRERPHPTHSHLDKTLAWVERAGVNLIVARADIKGRLGGVSSETSAATDHDRREVSQQRAEAMHMQPVSGRFG